MSNLGSVYEDDENDSPNRANAGKIVRDTGTNIQAIAVSKQIGAAIPTDTSGGLIKDVTYIPLYDSSFNRTGWKAISGKHLHDADTDEAGGSIFDIRQATSAILAEINMLNPIPANFVTTVVGSSTLTQEISGGEGRLKFLTSGAANDLITGRILGVSLSFATKCMFQFKGTNNASTQLLMRFGINTDRVEDSQDTARRQFGLEACDGHGTNYVIINANGNASSLTPTPTTAALNSGSNANYKLVQIPASEVRLYLDGVSVGFSTTNVASSGTTDPSRLFVAGVKTTTTSARQMTMYLLQILSKPRSTDLF